MKWIVVETATGDDNFEPEVARVEHLTGSNVLITIGDFKLVLDIAELFLYVVREVTNDS